MLRVGRWIALAVWLSVSCADEPGFDDDLHVSPVVRVRVLVNTTPSVRCPVVTGITAQPLQALLGAELSLEAFASSEPDSWQWRTNGGGSFSPPNQPWTRFRCLGQPGARLLQVTLRKRGCVDDTASVEVTCERAAEK